MILDVKLLFQRNIIYLILKIRKDDRYNVSDKNYWKS